MEIRNCYKTKCCLPFRFHSARAALPLASRRLPLAQESLRLRTTDAFPAMGRRIRQDRRCRGNPLALPILRLFGNGRSGPRAPVRRCRPPGSRIASLNRDYSAPPAAGAASPRCPLAARTMTPPPALQSCHKRPVTPSARAAAAARRGAGGRYRAPPRAGEPRGAAGGPWRCCPPCCCCSCPWRRWRWRWPRCSWGCPATTSRPG